MNWIEAAAKAAHDADIGAVWPWYHERTDQRRYIAMVQAVVESMGIKERRQYSSFDSQLIGAYLVGRTLHRSELTA
ncbi:transcriptional regulator, MarR family [Mycolicibacterium canariasense]|uniref:Transcriptional regulator, MarR family n=1 Tax=Mycolicibacterium canariasense TaxID=228230 RepID=A0A100WBZ8_MYCCR|nr:hypothetical protein [Mycolicibacterium canariasense]MCV7212634.1 hypothetical protein [Mycolicibacterium canariasense]GAS95502.1 transcriptional regulator, MarR family [Mycolicibacterium canariasense]